MSHLVYLRLGHLWFHQTLWGKVIAFTNEWKLLQAYWWRENLCGERWLEFSLGISHSSLTLVCGSTLQHTHIHWAAETRLDPSDQPLLHVGDKKRNKQRRITWLHISHDLSFARYNLIRRAQGPLILVRGCLFVVKTIPAARGSLDRCFLESSGGSTKIMKPRRRREFPFCLVPPSEFQLLVWGSAFSWDDWNDGSFLWEIELRFK